jgi:hypothetical protein
MKRILALVLVAGLAAGCSLGDEYPTYPLPTAAITVDLGAQATSGTAPCPSTDLAPVKIGWDATHRSISFGGPKVELPKGFSGRMLPTGRLEILAPDGAVVARDGDTLILGGTDTIHVCRVQGVVY